MSAPFVKTLVPLFQIPGYVRYFHGHSVGALYQVLQSKVWRQSIPKTKNADGWVTALCSLCASGHLATYVTPQELETILGIGKRRVVDVLYTLASLQLANVQPFDKGYIVTVGTRTGKEENFTIESWLELDPSEVTLLLIEHVVGANAKGAEKLLGELKKSSESGKKVQPMWKKSCNKKTFSNPTLLRPQREEVPPPILPILDKENRYTTKARNAPSGVAAFGSKTEALNRVSSETDWSRAEQAGDLALAQGATLEQVNSLLFTKVLSSYPGMSRTPRFAHTLAEVETNDALDDGAKGRVLGKLWAALHKDVHGAKVSQRALSETIGALKNGLGNVSLHQGLWTLKRSVGNESDLSFLAKSGRNLITLVKQNSAEYHTLLNQQREAELRREQQRLRASEEGERLEKLRTIADGYDPSKDTRLQEFYQDDADKKRRQAEHRERVARELARMELEVSG